MYDYYLGGKDHYPADRVAAEEVLRLVPEARRMARDNRAFLTRAVRCLAASGIRQFLDLGTGLPHRGNVAEIARGSDPEARTVHVDIDRMVCAHARALMAEEGRSAVVEGDLRQVRCIAENPGVRALIDFDRPVAILLTGVVHFIADDQEAAEVVRSYRDLLVPGGYLVLSHPTPGTVAPRRWMAAERVYAQSPSPVRMREPADIAGYFEGLRLIDPGLIDVTYWRPDGPVAVNDEGAYIVGGVARRVS